MSTNETAATHQLWVALPRGGALDDDQAGRLRRVVAAFCAAVRSGDPVELVIAVHQLSEVEARDVVLGAVAGLGDALGSTGAIVVREGDVPDGIAPDDVLLDGDVVEPQTRADARLHAMRSGLARITTLTPVLDPARWAQDFTPTKGFRHLVVDCGPDEGLTEHARGRGADVVRSAGTSLWAEPWRAAFAAAAADHDGRWLKPLQPGDQLAAGADRLLESVIDDAPDVGLVIFEHDVRTGDRLERWSALPETTLVQPQAALELAAAHGNWFGPPIGHLFSPAALQLVEAGGGGEAGEGEACLSVAARMPTLYVKASIGTRGPTSPVEGADLLREQLQEAVFRLGAAKARGPVDAGSGLALEEPARRWLVGSLTGAPGAAVGPERDVGVAEPPANAVPLGAGPIVALHHPELDASLKWFHGYVPLFAERSATYAYFPVLAAHPGAAASLGVGPDGVLRRGSSSWEVITSARDLQQRADLLVSFQGRPDLPHLAPPAEFTGFKAYHLMDFAYRASASAQALRDGGADLLMAYSRLDVHSAFFRAYYPGFHGRVLGLPFGFGSRFFSRAPFDQRDRRVVGMGSIGPVDETLCRPGEMDEWKHFYRRTAWVHPWRRRLLEESDRLKDVLAVTYPQFPESKDPTPRSEEVLSSYQLFANDESLMGIPPARTYEGAASGTVMIANHHASYEELGFRDGVNALFHRSQDLDDFERVVREALADQQRLATIAAAGMALVRSRYNHSTMADDLRACLLGAWSARGGGFPLLPHG